MLQKTIVFLLFLFPITLGAQVSISVQLPPAGLVQKDQLWNLVLVNNSNAPLDVTIFLDLKDPVTGQSILSAGTRNLFLAKGMKLMSVRDVQPVQYNYGVVRLVNNYLPLGTYLACYHVSRLSSKGVEILAEECVPVNISPLSPPLLNTPIDNSVLPNEFPQFTWIPPTPTEMFDRLTYDISVVEVQPGQNSAEAVLYNTPVFIKNYCRVPFESYPSTYSRLEKGKLYAWQVIANNDLNYSAPSAIWTFTLKEDSVAAVAVSTNYILLKNESEAAGINYVDADNLYIKYYSFEKEHDTGVRFIDNKGTIVREVKQKIIYGDNYLKFKLSARFHKGEIYKLVITDKQNTVHTASFSIK